MVLYRIYCVYIVDIFIDSYVGFLKLSKIEKILGLIILF